MSSKSPRISPNELEVLQVLWDLKSATLREVHQQMSEQFAYTTVQTLLDRLVEKGLVARDKSSRPAVHKATISRRRVAGQFVGLIVDKLCDGPAPLIAQLLKGREFTAAEIQEMRDLIDQAETSANKQSPPK